MSITEEQIKTKLTAELQPSHLELLDISDGCGAKFKAVIVSEKFVGKTLIDRHRLVNSILADEIKQIHAFTMRTLTLDEWEKEKNTSAPGKIILFGEHSVVYGKLAIAASISCRTTAIYAESDKNVVTVHFPKLRYSQNFELEDLRSKLNEELPLKSNAQKTQVNFQTTELIDIDSLINISANDVNVETANENTRRVKTALHVFFFLFRGILSSTSVQLTPCTIRVQSELMLGVGTGSSASFCVAIVSAFLCLLKQKTFPDGNISKSGFQEFKFNGDPNSFTEKEKDIINRWAYCGEKINHGNPSGIDNSICTYGSVIEINRGTRGNIHFLKNTPELGLLLINSGVDRNTSSLVAKVRALKEKHETIVNSIMEGMQGISEKAVSTLVKLNDLEHEKAPESDIRDLYSILEELFDLNHGLLSALTVSHAKLEHIRAITGLHGLHTKLTGAGGGGYAIALIPPNHPLGSLMECVNELQANGYKTDQVFLGGDGVSVKKLD